MRRGGSGRDNGGAEFRDLGAKGRQEGSRKIRGQDGRRKDGGLGTAKEEIEGFPESTRVTRMRGDLIMIKESTSGGDQFGHDLGLGFEV